MLQGIRLFSACRCSNTARINKWTDMCLAGNVAWRKQIFLCSSNLENQNKRINEVLKRVSENHTGVVQTGLNTRGKISYFGGIRVSFLEWYIIVLFI